MADRSNEVKPIQATEELNREWVKRLKAEAELATEFAGKVTAANSVPETAGHMPGMDAAADGDVRRRHAETHDANGPPLARGWPGGSS